ncbi:uncharacterized protein F4822DRAFT_387374 [Hypoxylon trugodes]|uniref:uncharacterized protein n=1 Tax=Hypoxylon trugodes TaxID=326681 RepID=UPI00219C0A9F|nr:uncharacterized protein F4822DRAFT_387374 [Hypoxylon trugodes]KAI1394187.1 hypothetical protein F4822DRAFT_387374 [Hypoxylon trugodes]
MLKNIFFLSTFALGATALNETISGYKYFLSGPKVDQPKSEYEHAAADRALALLENRLGSQPLPDLPEDNVTAILKLKQDLGTVKLEELLLPDMADADTYWHSAISKSGSGWVSADARAVVFLPAVTFQGFAAWYSSDKADAANLAANPEHYVKETVNTTTGLSSKILEGWGGVTTNFTIPNFGAPDRSKDPFLRPLPEFPVQQAGDKVLRDGTRFGVLHISLREVDGAAYGQSGKGFEVYSTVWYQDGVQDDHLEQERRHMVIEIVNLTLQAQKDLSGQ